MAKKKKKMEITPFEKEMVAAREAGLKTFKFKGSRYKITPEVKTEVPKKDPVKK